MSQAIGEGEKRGKSETGAREGERQFRCRRRRHVATLRRKEGGYVVIGRKRLIVTESHTSIFQTGGRKKSRRERNGKTGRNEKIGGEREERGLPLPVDNQAERGKKHNLQSTTTTM